MWITFRTGARTGDTVEVTGERCVVGRSSASDLPIRERQLSRSHAALTPLPDGRVKLEDLDSKNGTFVNGSRLRAPVMLGGGELLRFGDTEVAVTRERPDAAAATPAADGKQEGRSDSFVHRIKLERTTRRNAIIGTTTLVLAVVLVVLTVTGVFDRGGAEGNDVGDVVAAVEPSTVLIHARANGRKRATGTGWVLDAGERLIVTNNHVINGGDALAAGVDEDRRNAQIVGTSPCEDIAVLRLGNADRLRTLPLLPDQGALKQGQTVIALGFPENASLEAQLTATQGVVSVASTSFNERTVDAPRFSNLVQTDAAINPGNSGGPLVDLDNRLVGMNTAVRTSRAGGSGVVQGQGFAIGVDRIRSVTAKLRRGRSIGWTGFRSLVPGPGRALTASDPAPGTQAAKRFGGDGQIVIRTIDGKAMNGTLARYCVAVAGRRSGAAVTLGVRGPGGATRDVRLRLE